MIQYTQQVQHDGVMTVWNDSWPSGANTPSPSIVDINHFASTGCNGPAPRIPGRLANSYNQDEDVELVGLSVCFYDIPREKKPFFRPIIWYDISPIILYHSTTTTGGRGTAPPNEAVAGIKGAGGERGKQYRIYFFRFELINLTRHKKLDC